MILALLMAAAPAWAYIPPSQFIMRSLAQKHAGVKGVRIRSIVSAVEGEKPTGIRFNEVTWFDTRSRHLKSWAVDETGKKLYAVERIADSLNPVDQLLFEPDAKAVVVSLKNLGVPIKADEELLILPDEEARRGTESEALARWNGGVNWVIGHRGKPEPQLWVEKDSFVPTRLIVPPNEIQMGSYKFSREFPYPRAITGILGSAAVLRDELTDVTVNPAKLDAEMKAELPLGWTEAGNGAPTSLRELIQKYYELIR